MDGAATGTLRPDRRDAAAVLILLGLCAVVLFLRLGGMALLNQDEGMHAVTAKEMVRTGDWLTPRFNGEDFYDKPALFTWLVAASFVERRGAAWVQAFGAWRERIAEWGE